MEQDNVSGYHNDEPDDTGKAGKRLDDAISHGADSGKNPEDMVLGGSIVLSGFKQIDNNSIIIIKKIVGHYARAFSEKTENFEEIKVTLKPIHQTQDNPKKFEIHAHLRHDGRIEAAEETGFNLFSTLDASLKRLESAALKK